MTCGLAELSPRQRQIAVGLSRGLTRKAIASDLAISINTLKSYLDKIFHKLQAHSSLEVVLKIQPYICETCPYFGKAAKPSRKVTARAATESRRPSSARC